MDLKISLIVKREKLGISILSPGILGLVWYFQISTNNADMITMSCYDKTLIKAFHS